MMLKETVNKQGTQPVIFYCIGIVDVLYQTAGFDCVVTSLTDSHETRPNSRHNKGLAVDFRTRHLSPVAKQTIFDSMKAVLEPKGYDVVLEADHYHVEYDPKGNETWFKIEASGP